MHRILAWHLPLIVALKKLQEKSGRKEWHSTQREDSPMMLELKRAVGSRRNQMVSPLQHRHSSSEGKWSDGPFWFLCCSPIWILGSFNQINFRSIWLKHLLVLAVAFPSPAILVPCDTVWRDVIAIGFWAPNYHCLQWPSRLDGTTGCIHAITPWCSDAASIDESITKIIYVPGKEIVPASLKMNSGGVLVLPLWRGHILAMKQLLLPLQLVVVHLSITSLSFCIWPFKPKCFSETQMQGWPLYVRV